MSTTTPTSRTALVEGLMERFPHVPPEAVLKEDLLRTGIAFDESALSDNLDERRPGRRRGRAHTRTVSGARLRAGASA